ncbi:MAG: SDR family NAD(P)-dependent oxidoreductase [Gammaproteobacteria bacterium]|nr:SDR family NAD(P)-dependent oxidoreductase [Gammaproteobacteria bacterium]NNJ72748.1 SDR family NAD(P)-dependent oxidoreductase [Enterobacterales bacterium]
MKTLPTSLVNKLFIFLVILPLAVAMNSTFASESATQKAVLVTGASSGIGLHVTKELAAQGYFVYAGARKDKDLKALNAIENVQAIRLDVNKWDEINEAVKTVQQAGRGLYGVVNNAGVAVLEPLTEIEEDDFHFQMNVNIYGPYRITKAFAPMIIESKGRVVTIGSIAGTLSGQFWGLTA